MPTIPIATASLLGPGANPRHACRGAPDGSVRGDIDHSGVLLVKPREDQLTATVRENLSTLFEHRSALERDESVHERLAAAISRRTGTMWFAYVHAVVVVGWILWNAVLPVPRFDPYPFVLLAMSASVEAIFLSTFVLVSQARAARIAEQRAELDVQIGLLSEREITRVLSIVTALAARLDVKVLDGDIPDLMKDTDPKDILDQIQRHEMSAEEPDGAKRGDHS